MIDQGLQGPNDILTRRVPMNSEFLTYIRRSNGDSTGRRVRLTPEVVAALRDRD
jgi:hypothetical protein